MAAWKAPPKPPLGRTRLDWPTRPPGQDRSGMRSQGNKAMYIIKIGGGMKDMYSQMSAKASSGRGECWVERWLELSCKPSVGLSPL